VKLLLDSHSFLWAIQEPKRLGGAARKALGLKANEVAVSSVNFWEIALKYSLGKLKLKGIEPGDLPEIAREHDFTICSLSGETAATFHNLPRIPDHRDPFDRMLVWQAMQDGWTLVSRDGAMEPYREFGLDLLW